MIPENSYRQLIVFLSKYNWQQQYATWKKSTLPLVFGFFPFTVNINLFVVSCSYLVLLGSVQVPMKFASKDFNTVSTHVDLHRMKICITMFQLVVLTTMIKLKTLKKLKVQVWEADATKNEEVWFFASNDNKILFFLGTTGYIFCKTPEF